MAGIPAADDKRIYFASRDNMLRAVDRKSGNLRWKAALSSRPAGGPLRLNDLLLMPLVSNQILGFDPETGKPTVTAAAAGEIGLQPYVRRDVRQTLPQLITVSREGQLQGFGRRFEPVPQPLGRASGAPAVPRPPIRSTDQTQITPITITDYRTHPLVLEGLRAEVHQQAASDLAHRQVVQQLRLVRRRERGHCLHFDDDVLEADEIQVMRRRLSA